MAKVLLISYDNGSHIPFFPINLFYLCGALKHAKHEPCIWSQDIHHGNEDSLTKVLDDNKFDVVGLGFCAGYYQYEKAKKISEAVNRSTRRNSFRYVAGGHGPAGAPQYFIDKMGYDSVVVGDGENAICEVAEGKKGIIQGVPTLRDEAPIGIYEDMADVLPIYRLIRWPTSERTDLCFPILSSKGCIWNCSFCFRMREGYHERSIEAIIQEIKWLHTHAGINHFNFADELLMSSVKRTEAICCAILELPFKIKWDCNGRLNFAESKLLSLMKESGAHYVNFGIESMNQKILNSMGKGLTVDQIISGVEATLQAHLSPGLNLLWGFPNDTEKNLKEEVKFLKEYDPCHELRTIRPVTPYPNCRLYQNAIRDGLLSGASDFYENKHKNSDLISVNFMDIPTEEAHQMLFRANVELIDNYYSKRSANTLSSAYHLYKGDTSFRGFREV